MKSKLLLSIFALLYATVICGSGIELNKNEAYFFTDSKNYAQLEELILKITTGGGRVYHVFPDKTFFGRLSNLNLDDKNITDRILYFSDSRVDLDTIKSFNDDYGYKAALIWNYNHLNRVERFEKARKKDPTPLSLERDLLLNSSSVCNRLNSRTLNIISQNDGGFCDTSEYMIGTISVTIFFPECVGSDEECTESWDDLSKDYFLIRAEDALQWWVEREPKAKLMFVYEWLTESVSIEPINHNYCQEKIWTAEIMSGLGFDDYEDYRDNVRDFDNSQREKYKTDWAFTIFAVNCRNDADGFFKKDIDPDCPGSEYDWFAYSWLGGPFTVIAYDKNSDNSEYANKENRPYNTVIAHETAHIFYALDEYAGSDSYCDERSGYLNVPNQNYEDVDCLSNVLCLMRGPYEAPMSFLYGELCQYTREQIGWRDSDEDGILDILDFDPEARIISISSSPAPNIRGIADCSEALENENPQDPGANITVDKISSVTIRTDGSEWLPAESEDGRFDEPLENFNIKLPPIPSEGNHDVEIKITTSFGSESINRFEDLYATENLYLPVAAYAGYTNTVLIASNFSSYASECTVGFTQAENGNFVKKAEVVLSPNETKFIDFYAMGIRGTGYATIVTHPEGEIKFYAYNLNYRTMKASEMLPERAISEQGIIPLWIVSPEIKTTSYVYIYNVDEEEARFEIAIKERISNTQKELTFDLLAGGCEIIDISVLFENASQGQIFIYAPNRKFLADNVIFRNDYGPITQVHCTEKAWK